jgi:hypothetical protein
MFSIGKYVAKLKAKSAQLFGGAIGKVIGLAIGIGVLYILSGMTFLASASTGIVSTASTLATVLPIVGVIAAFTVAGLLYSVA